MSSVRVVAAFIRRDFRIHISYRLSFVLQMSTIFFFLALYYYLSKIVDQREFAARQDISGSYFGYAAVGLALLSILQVGLSSFSQKMREEQTTGTFEALMASPASPSLVVLASAVYDLLRSTAFAFVLICTGMVVFGLELDTDPASLGLAAVALVGCLALFASLGVAVAACTVIFKQTAVMAGMVVSGLALLSGVYFPIDVLPGALQQLAEILPFTWGLDVVRAALLGGNVDHAQLAGLFGSAAVLLPIAVLGFTAAVRRARQTGTLAQY
jgi:ABC-2 type transport system permease protein